MTTNVFDKAHGSFATDSRWSQRYGRWIVYVDDTECHKIEVAANTAFMFAGKGFRIQSWKEWIRAGADQNLVPDFDGLCVCAVDIATKTVVICEGMPVKEDEVVVGGSGWKFAYPCWTNNRDPQRSIESAKKLDPATGGETKYFSFLTQEHNLNKTVFGEGSIAEVDRAILSRGIVMDIGNAYPGSAPYKLSELAASNDEVRELQSKIANGELSADAPSDAMDALWTDEQKSRVKKALGEIFKWKTP